MQLEEAFENESNSPDPVRRNLGQARKDAMQLRSSVSEAESLVQKARLEAEFEAKLKIEKAIQEAEFEAKLKIEKVIQEIEFEAKKAAADIADAKLAFLMKQGLTRDIKTRDVSTSDMAIRLSQHMEQTNELYEDDLM